MKAVIFDMDGTLADVEHRRPYLTDGHPDWEGWNMMMPMDTPQEHICDLARYYFDKDGIILICTGRFEEHREVTKKQLLDWNIPYAGLYMREYGDYSSDVDIKRALLNQIREEGYDPYLAIDDRDGVVKMWREEGLICFQVAEGAF